ncbi:MAG: antitoxin of toxin-antitoxin stability system [Lactobacillus sp.]|jgi:antitoxin component of MazEF toxin-antitoxin module|nr:antitoxin of toxin-antitoxin stability system [Lactobacillus sp.]
MVRVKIRKVGNSKVFTVPKAFKTTSAEYEAFLGRDGAITFLPARTNPFDSKDAVKKYGKFDNDTTGFIL